MTEYTYKRNRCDLKGEDHPASKLKEATVREIRDAIERGESLASIGRKYNTSPENVWAIKMRRSWTHI